MVADAGPSRAAALGVAALTLVALLLRLWGVGFMLPHVTQSDGLILTRQLQRLRAGKPPIDSSDHETRTYPLLIAELTALIPDRSRGPADRPRPLEEHLARAGAHWMDVRLVSVLLSSLIVPGTWLLARRFLSRPWSLLAAGLVATSLVHVSISQMERPHGVAATTALLAVLAALWMRRRASVLSFALAGLAAGLAIGTLQSGVAVLIPLGAAFLLRRRGAGAASGWWILLSAGAIAPCVGWLYPGSLAAPGIRGGSSDSPLALDLAGHDLYLRQLDGSGFLRVLGTLYSYDPVLLLLSAVGLGFALRELARRPRLAEARRKDLLVALTYAVPYLCAIGLYAQTFERFVLQLLPYLACLAAWGVRRLADEVRGRAVALRWGLSATVACAVAFPAVAAAKLSSVRAAPDTITEAAGWIRANVDPERERLYVLPFLTLPLFYEGEALRDDWERSQRTRWLEYQLGLGEGQREGPRYAILQPDRSRASMRGKLGPDPLEFFRRERIDYVVVENPGESSPRVLKKTFARLRSEARLVFRTSPLRVDTGRNAEVGTRYTRAVLWRPFVRHVLAARCTGPTVEIYRLPREAGRARGGGPEEQR